MSFTRFYEESKESKEPVSEDKPETENLSSIEVVSSPTSSVLFNQEASITEANEAKRAAKLSLLRREINQTLQHNNDAECIEKKRYCCCLSKTLGGSTLVVMLLVGVITSLLKANAAADCPDILLPDLCNSSTSRILNRTLSNLNSCTNATIDTWCDANKLQHAGLITGPSIAGIILLVLGVLILLAKGAPCAAHSVSPASFGTVNNDLTPANPEGRAVIPTVTSPETLAITVQEEKKSQMILAWFSKRRQTIREVLNHPAAITHQLVEEYDGCQEAKPTAPSFNI